MTTDHSKLRAVCLRVALILLAVFVLNIALSERASAQPPRRSGDQTGRSERSGRAERGRGTERGGSRDRNNRGSEERSDNNRPGGGNPGGGAPGGFPGGFPGGPGGNQGQPGEGNGQNGGQPDEGQNSQPERKVDLDQALESTIGTSAIKLNQNSFRSRDGFQLIGSYYKGKGDKDTPVVIILPGLESAREDETFTKLAVLLAKEGCAVLIPDLRGRGESKVNMPNFPGAPGNRSQQNANADVNPADVSKMINDDREVWFEFLVYVHNKGLCNIKKTIIVGSEFSAALASAWAKNDWSGKGAVYQNVVGLALISPDAVDGKKKSKKRDEDEEEETAAPTYDSLASLETVRSRAKGKGVFGYFIVVGKYDEDKLASAQLIQRKIGGKADEEAKPADKVVLLLGLDTEKQGDVLYTYDTFNLNAQIIQFVAKRMKELPPKRAKWQEIELKRGW